MTEFFQNQVYQQLEDAQKALNEALDNSNYIVAYGHALAVAELIKVVALMADEPEPEEAEA
jgi:hypothetical protein